MTTWTPTQRARNGDVEIAYDRLTGSDGMPLLLVMGLATSRFWWPTGLCDAFAREGFAVARYDQRDAGESTRLPDVAGSNPFRALFAKKGDAYTAEDMVDDAVAVFDELGWPKAHVFGHSMGGVVAQRLALRHPDRVLSVVSSAALPSDVSGLRVARYLRVGLLARLARTRFPDGRDGDIEASLAVARGVESRPTRSTRRLPGSRSRARSTPARETPRRRAGRSARSRTAPGCVTCTGALVLHGEADPILRPAAGRATAEAVNGARLVTFPGVGHDLPAELWPTVAREVGDLARQAAAVERSADRSAEASELGELRRPSLGRTTPRRGSRTAPAGAAAAHRARSASRSASPSDAT